MFNASHLVRRLALKSHAIIPANTYLIVKLCATQLSPIALLLHCFFTFDLSNNFHRCHFSLIDAHVGHFHIPLILIPSRRFHPITLQRTNTTRSSSPRLHFHEVAIFSPPSQCSKTRVRTRLISNSNNDAHLLSSQTHRDLKAQHHNITTTTTTAITSRDRLQRYPYIQ